MDLAMMIILTAENRPLFKIVMVEILAAFPLAAGSSACFAPL
jgi:hypothetical protein